MSLQYHFSASHDGTPMDQAFADLRRAYGKVGNLVNVYRLGNTILDCVYAMNQLGEPLVVQVTNLWSRLGEIGAEFMGSCTQQVPDQVDQIRMASVKYLAAWVDPTGQLVKSAVLKDGTNPFDHPRLWEDALAVVTREAGRQFILAPVLGVSQG